MKQESPFCPDIAATPDGRQVWLTLKDIGKVMEFDAKPPFAVLRTIDTGAITNHVNIARTPRGQFAYVTVGTQNAVKVFRTDTFEQVATVPVGALPHGLWPSGDGSRMYVGFENGDGVAVIDTATNRLLTTVRRQNIRHNLRRRLAECGPRLGVDVRRRACGVASADVRWSFA